jgi:hypothetical protein
MVYLRGTVNISIFSESATFVRKEICLLVNKQDTANKIKLSLHQELCPKVSATTEAGFSA